MEGSYSCTTALESGHDPKVDTGLIADENVTLRNESVAEENHNDNNICLKTERLSPNQREDDPSVENGLVMPTALSTAPRDTEDSLPQPTAKAIQEQKLDTQNETEGNASERSKTVDGGAVWDIFRREDVPKLIAYLNRHKHEFRHTNNQPVKAVCITIHHISCK